VFLDTQIVNQTAFIVS